MHAQTLEPRRSEISLGPSIFRAGRMGQEVVRIRL